MSSIVLFIVVVAVIAWLFLFINFVFAPHNPYQEKYSMFKCGFHSFHQTRLQVNIAFFVFGLVYLLLGLEILVVFLFTVSEYINDIYGLTSTLLFLLGSIVAGFFGRKVGVSSDSSEWFNISLGFQFDSLTVAMLIPVLIISYFIYIYYIIKKDVEQNGIMVTMKSLRSFNSLIYGVFIRYIHLKAVISSWYNRIHSEKKVIQILSFLINEYFTTKILLITGVFLLISCCILKRLGENPDMLLHIFIFIWFSFIEVDYFRYLVVEKILSEYSKYQLNKFPYLFNLGLRLLVIIIVRFSLINIFAILDLLFPTSCFNFKYFYNILCITPFNLLFPIFIEEFYGNKLWVVLEQIVKLLDEVLSPYFSFMLVLYDNLSLSQEFSGLDASVYSIKSSTRQAVWENPKSSLGHVDWERINPLYGYDSAFFKYLNDNRDKLKSFITDYLGNFLDMFKPINSNSKLLELKFLGLNPIGNSPLLSDTSLYDTSPPVWNTRPELLFSQNLSNKNILYVKGSFVYADLYLEGYNLNLKLIYSPLNEQGVLVLKNYNKIIEVKEFNYIKLNKKSLVTYPSFINVNLNDTNNINNSEWGILNKSKANIKGLNKDIYNTPLCCIKLYNVCMDTKYQMGKISVFRDVGLLGLEKNLEINLDKNLEKNLYFEFCPIYREISIPNLKVPLFSYIIQVLMTKLNIISRHIWSVFWVRYLEILLSNISEFFIKLVKWLKIRINIDLRQISPNLELGIERLSITQDQDRRRISSAFVGLSVLTIVIQRTLIITMVDLARTRLGVGTVSDCQFAHVEFLLKIYTRLYYYLDTDLIGHDVTNVLSELYILEDYINIFRERNNALLKTFKSFLRLLIKCKNQGLAYLLPVDINRVNEIVRTLKTLSRDIDAVSRFIYDCIEDQDLSDIW